MTRRNVPEDSNNTAVRTSVCALLDHTVLQCHIPMPSYTIIAGTFETVGVTEEGSVGCEAAGSTVFTGLSVATSRVHLLSPFKSHLTAVQLPSSALGCYLRRTMLVHCTFAGCLKATLLFAII
jgi:hypothetical protein